MKRVPWPFPFGANKWFVTPTGARFTFDMIDAVSGDGASEIIPHVTVSRDGDRFTPSRHAAIESDQPSRYFIAIDNDEFEGADVLVLQATHPECIRTMGLFDLKEQSRIADLMRLMVIT